MSDPDQGCIGNQEKGYATEALAKFNCGDFASCLSALEQLEVLRPSDVKVAHNKIVAQCRAVTDSSTLPLPEVIKQIEGLAKTAGINIYGSPGKEENEWTLLTYNLAVAKFQQKQFIQAAQLSSRLEHSDKTGQQLKKKVYFLNAELSLALRQPEEATKYTNILQPLVGNNEEEAARLMMLKARTQVLNRQMKALKKELKSVVLPGSQGVTCEFVRSNIEYQCKNYRKSIKMLNSGAQSAGNKVFPHYYNNLGCIHQNMKKPNLAVYYFKNAMEKLDNGGGNDAASQQRVDGEKELSMSINGIPRSQVLFNISISLLHAKRPHIAFELLLEVASSYYLDPHVWFHLAECCIQHQQEKSGLEMGHVEVGSGLSHKLIASNPPPPQQGETGTMPALTLDFAYVCLKHAEYLLPKNDSGNIGNFCPNFGFVGNPMTWKELENLRLAILAAKAYVALSLGDFMMGGKYAGNMLETPGLSSSFSMLAHLYYAESCILQDKLTEAIKHLDPENITDLSFVDPIGTSDGSATATLDPANCRRVMQLNLAVGFALREEWEKASSLARPLYRVDTSSPDIGGQNLGVQILILNLYIALRRGDVTAAIQYLLDRYPALKYCSQNSVSTNK